VTETSAKAILSALNSGKITKALWLRGSRLGDFLFTTPALGAFKERWPEVEIALLTNPYTGELAQLCPLISKTLLFQGKEASLAGSQGHRVAKRYRAELEDIQLLLAPRPRPEIPTIAQRMGVPFVFPGETEQGEDRETHVVLQTWKRFASLDLAKPGPMVLRAPERGHPLLDQLPQPPILLHPGCDESARWKFRRGVPKRLWPLGHWKTLAASLEDLGQPFVFLSGSRRESRWVQRFLRKEEIQAPHLQGIPLTLLAGTMAKSLALVGVDSGPLHLATALGLPSVGLFGPSPASFTGPWAPSGSSHVIQKPLPCSPCQGKGVHCPKNVCMEEIRPEEVLAAILNQTAVKT
jgi:ADP-heptose:LPS heptosyltransferase